VLADEVVDEVDATESAVKNVAPMPVADMA